MTLANEENIEATVVAKVTDTGRFRMTWMGDTILDISREFINTNGAKQVAGVVVSDKSAEDIKKSFDMPLGQESLYESMKLTLSDLNCCAKKGLIERFDSSIGAGSVLAPLGGKYQMTPAAGMVAKLPVKEGETETVTLMSYGFDPAVANASTYHSALYAVVHSATKIVAMGGQLGGIRLTFQEYFEKLTSGSSWAKPFSALLGALKAQKQLGIPSIGGKDSMSGTFMDINVPPTLVSFAVCAGDFANIVSQEFKKAGSTLVLFTVDKDEKGIINFDSYKKNMLKVAALTSKGKLLAADAIGKGGLFQTTFKMAIGNKIGAEIAMDCKPCLFRADYGAILAEIDSSENLEQLLADSQYRVVGKTINEELLKVSAAEDCAEISLNEACKINMEPLEEIFPVRTADSKEFRDDTKVVAPAYTKRNTNKPAVKIASPRVIIPTFPGTNCEQDSKRAFVSAGAEAEILLIRNMNAQLLDESIRKFEKKIKESQIIMIPGGFSGGDEPDGSAKFITAVFRNARIKDAVADLLEKRDGLIIGICNGFQSLIKLGLVPYGRIIETDEHCPTLTYNKIGRHAARFVDTRVASVKSPWLANTNVGDIHTLAISHGEGRFIASDDVLNKLIENGQIATQYVDLNGKPSMDISANPNGSALSIEGITSPDGRVFGKMAHSERIGAGVHKNISGDKDQRIFEAGVQYFK
ncbi:MAG: phosphoribosylformylglycinamidine synthase subunit PurQ [Eubacteriales bacterium]|nr:phosphoribosylformylglycinamidine synthase subunit PurQ [Eubacteriales bacterium]